MIPSATTRIQLLAAARACFAAEGFEASTMGRIAEAAELPLAAAFVHFPAKQAFALAMYHGLVADLQARLADLPRGSVAERFAALMTLKLDRLDAHRDEMCALLAAAVDPKGPLGVLSESTAAIRARMAGTVHAVVVGATDAPPEPARLAGLLYGLHLAIVLLWTQDDGRMARGTIGLCCKLLALAGPFLPLPEVAAGLGRLDAVFGDRLAPVVGTDVDRSARWLLARLMRHRRLLPGVPQGPATEDQLARHRDDGGDMFAERSPWHLLRSAGPHEVRYLGPEERSLMQEFRLGLSWPSS